MSGKRETEKNERFERKRIEKKREGESRKRDGKAAGKIYFELRAAHSWKLYFISILCQYASYNVYLPASCNEYWNFRGNIYIDNLGRSIVRARVHVLARTARVLPFSHVLRQHYFSPRVHI